MASINDPSSIATGAQLGSATFVVSANTSAFNQAMAQTQQGAKNTYALVTKTFDVMASRVESSFDKQVAAAVEATRAQKNIRMMLEQDAAKAGKSGFVLGTGILYAAQALDDLQYGFSGIVNNIPQIVMGLGLGSGVAGAVGILVVAANQLYKNWDKLTAAMFGSSEKLPTLSDDMEELAYQLKEINKQVKELSTKKFKEGLNLFDEEKLGKLKGLAKTARERIAEEKLINNASKPSGEQENAKAFKKALGELPEGATTIIKMLMDKMSPQDAQHLVAQAIMGKRWAMEDIAKAIPKGAVGFAVNQALPAVREVKAARKEEEKRIAKAQKEFALGAAQKAREEKKTKALARAKEIARKNKLIAEIQKRRRALLDRTRKLKKSKTFSNTSAFVNAMQTGALNAIPKAQLVEAKRLNGLIEKLRDDVRNIRNARFGAP